MLLALETKTDSDIASEAAMMSEAVSSAKTRESPENA